jgi:hypothetical protein
LRAWVGAAAASAPPPAGNDRTRRRRRESSGGEAEGTGNGGGERVDSNPSFRNFLDKKTVWLQPDSQTLSPNH